MLCGATLWLRCAGCSLSWLCLSQSTDSQARGLQQLGLPGSRAQAQLLWPMGLLVPPCHMRVSLIRDQTHGLLHRQADSLPLIAPGSPKGSLDFSGTKLGVPPGEGFPRGSDSETIWTIGDLGSIPGSGRAPGKGMATHSVFWPGEFHDRGAWWATVHGITESDTVEQLTHTHTHTHQVINSYGLRARLLEIFLRDKYDNDNI